MHKNKTIEKVGKQKAGVNVGGTLQEEKASGKSPPTVRHIGFDVRILSRKKPEKNGLFLVRYVRFRFQADFRGKSL